jgi:hypothetical protein
MPDASFPVIVCRLYYTISWRKTQSGKDPLPPSGENLDCVFLFSAGCGKIPKIRKNMPGGMRHGIDGKDAGQPEGF